MWIKTKTHQYESLFANTDSFDRIQIDEGYCIVGVNVNRGKFNIKEKLYSSSNPSIEGTEKKMAKIERYLRDGCSFCDLDGDA